MITKLLRWAIVLGVVVWLGSMAVTAGARYLELSDVIERTVVDARPAGGIPEGGMPSYLKRVHAQVYARAHRPNAPLEAEAILVTAAPGTLWVTVRWTQPVVTWQGRTVWALPLSLTRTFSNVL